MDHTIDDDDRAEGVGTAPGAQPVAAGSYRTESFLNTDEIPAVDDLFAAAARSAGVPTAPAAGAATAVAAGPAATDDAESGDATAEPARASGSGGSGGSGGSSGAGSSSGDAPAEPKERFRTRHPVLTITGIVVVIAMIPLMGTYARAMTKEGNESAMARTAGWARDMHMGFLVDWAEQRQYATDQFQKGGEPDKDVFKPVDTGAATITTAATGSSLATTTVPQVPHTPPPGPVPSPVSPPAEGEGVWSPAGQLVDGLPAVYTTKVRPDAEHTSLAVFVAWVDPKLTRVELMPGTDLPGGEWANPHFITPELCPKAIMATNGMFRMDQARGGYWADDKEPFKLLDGAASLVLLKDGTVDVAEWGRDYTAADLPRIKAVRQNLELMVDGGVASPTLKGDKDWGALLKNVYFVWRSGYGVTADGALVYAGGPALTPENLARTLQGAGAVRVMEGDINPEWVTANLFNVDPATGQCVGTKGLEGSEDKGGMRQPANRYLSTDKRDFVAVFAR